MSHIINPFDDSAILLPAFDISTQAGKIAWLQQRRGGIGSSDCSSVLGLNPWPNSTPWNVFMDKTGQVPLDDGRDNEQMEIGREVESAIVRIVSRRLGVTANTLPALQSREYPHMRANIDAYFNEPEDGAIPFEAKNTSEYLLSDWSDGEVPDHAELQILHTLVVTDAPYGYVGGMVGGRMVVHKRIERDEALLAHIIDCELDMWERVQGYLALRDHYEAGELLDDLGRDEYERQLRAFEPALTARDTVDSIMGVSAKRDVDINVVDSDEAARARTWWEQYTDAAIAEKDAIADKAEARNNLIRIADGHDVIAEAVLDAIDDEPDYKVVARVQRGNFAKSRFVEAHPEIAEVTMKKVEVLDVDALKREEPELYKKFQSRSVKGPKKGDPQ